MSMFKSKANKRSLQTYLKKNTTKDITDWCTKNIPCPEDDRPTVTVTEFSASKMTTREVALMGILPFNFEEFDLSDCVVDFLDVRRHTLDPNTKQVITRKVCFRSAVLVRTSFRGSDCTDVDFNHSNAEYAVFNSCVLRNCNFDGVVMKKSSLTAADLNHASLRDVVAPGTNFQYANLEYASLTGGWFCSKEHYEKSKDNRAIKTEFAFGLWIAASFTNARLKGADLRNARLCGCDFSGANLTCASLQGADLRFANFSNARLTGANLSGANLTGARGLAAADMAWVVLLGGVTIDQDLGKHKDGKKFLKSRIDVEVWAQELSEVNLSHCDLQDFNLSNSQLVGCLFCGSDLRGCDLSGANLTGADFSDADMYNADLSGANLSSAIFKNADMRCSNISGVSPPLREIQSQLLEAKNLQGMTCTTGGIPDELKSHGVNEGGLNANTKALADAEIRMREEKKRRLEEAKVQREREYESAVVERLDTLLQETRVGTALEVPVVRLRLLQSLLREHMLNPFVKDIPPSERDERWQAFCESFYLATDSPNLKKLYITLIADGVKESRLVTLWRRTHDLKVQCLGTLENMCLETMLRSKEWSSWSPAVLSAVASAKTPRPERLTYLKLLFERLLTKPASPPDLRKMQRDQTTQDLPELPLQEEALTPGAPGVQSALHSLGSPAGPNPTTFVSLAHPGTPFSPMSMGSPMTMHRPFPGQPIRTSGTAMLSGYSQPGNLFSVLRSTAPVGTVFSPPGVPLPAATMPMRPNVMGTPPIPGTVPPPPPSGPTPTLSTTLPGASMSSSVLPGGITGSVVNAPPIPPSTQTLPGGLQPAGSLPGSHNGASQNAPSPPVGPPPSTMSLVGPANALPPPPPGNPPPGLMGSLSMTAPQTGGDMMVPPQMSNPLLGATMMSTGPLMTGPAGIMMAGPAGMGVMTGAYVVPGSGGMVMSPVRRMTGPLVGPGVLRSSAGTVYGAQHGYGGGSGSRVQCVECGQVMDPNYITMHKRECKMRLVSCSQCNYSMRYVQWDNHNKYCNTIGPCPICKKTVKDNLILHLYAQHMPELMESGFFKGVEPPRRSR